MYVSIFLYQLQIYNNKINTVFSHYNMLEVQKIMKDIAKSTYIYMDLIQLDGLYETDRSLKL